MHNENEDGPSVTHVSKIEARSGSSTRVTKNILMISLVLIVLVLAFAVSLGFFTAEQTGADRVNGDNAAQENSM